MKEIKIAALVIGIVTVLILIGTDQHVKNLNENLPEQDSLTIDSTKNDSIIREPKTLSD